MDERPEANVECIRRQLRAITDYLSREVWSKTKPAEVSLAPDQVEKNGDDGATYPDAGNGR